MFSQMEVGRETNSNDPLLVQSRLFVGNLNNNEVTEAQVRQIFMKYGPVQGLSIHKGYCFVQYSNPTDAQKAINGESGKFYGGSRIDVKRAMEGKNRRDRDSPRGAGAGPAARSTGIRGPPNYTVSPAVKRSRIDITGPKSRNLVTVVENAERRQRELERQQRTSSSGETNAPVVPSLMELSVPVTDDLLICGVCRSLFHELRPFVEHKRRGCQLRNCCSKADSDTEADGSAAAGATADELTSGGADEAIAVNTEAAVEAEEDINGQTERSEPLSPNSEEKRLLDGIEPTAATQS